MSKLLLIDGAHRQETRVAVLDNGRIEDFDHEIAGSEQLRGNIYLAKIVRVEPSLQAAFVDYGGNRHGFLAFDQIHPDYYNLTKEDREKLLEEAAADAARLDDDDIAEDDENDANIDEDTPNDNSIVVEKVTISLDEAESGAMIMPPTDRRKPHQLPLHKRYKIQDVIKRRQILLVQVIKEERGNKGAALSTYMSLAGRFSVLMPNTPRGGGISRKISNSSDRKRLKEIVSTLDVPKGMGLIVRTAGAKKSKTELVRDYDYLTQTWSKIRDKTLKSIAPKLVHQEGSLTFRAIRDLFDKTMEEVLISGDEAYQTALELAELVMPGQTSKIVQWHDDSPLFYTKGAESQLESIYSPTVELPSGGYLVINQTEALVAIDVNSGKSTKQKSIEDTALSTNLEAAVEACRQMRLRDLAGLVVIDFIDMEESRNNRAVEKKIAECLAKDRARVQNSRISQFGLMEISRQRRRAGVINAVSEVCAHCEGTGRVRSASMSAMQLLRALDKAASTDSGAHLEVKAPMATLLFLINNSRDALSDIEYRAQGQFHLMPSDSLSPGKFEIRHLSQSSQNRPDMMPQRGKNNNHHGSSNGESTGFDGEEKNGNSVNGGNKRRRKRRAHSETVENDAHHHTGHESENTTKEAQPYEKNDTEPDSNKKRRRRRKRRDRPVTVDVPVDMEDLEIDTQIISQTPITTETGTITPDERSVPAEASLDDNVVNIANENDEIAPKMQKERSKSSSILTSEVTSTISLVKDQTCEDPNEETAKNHPTDDIAEEITKPKRSGWWSS